MGREGNDSGEYEGRAPEVEGAAVVADGEVRRTGRCGTAVARLAVRVRACRRTRLGQKLGLGRDKRAPTVSLGWEGALQSVGWRTLSGRLELGRGGRRNVPDETPVAPACAYGPSPLPV